MSDDVKPDSPKPIRRERETKYPTHLTTMVTQEMKDAVAEQAEVDGSKGAVVRNALFEYLSIRGHTSL